MRLPDQVCLGNFPARWREIDLPKLSGGAPNTLSLYCVDEPDSLFDREALLSSAQVPDPPYWALVWIGARALAAYLRAHPPAADTKVLDLGCGLGLSGLAAAESGARVTLADYVPECLEFAQASIERLGLENCQCRLLDFTRERIGEKFDLIVAADIVYEPAAYQPLGDFLDSHLASGGHILLTESLRADAKLFIAAMLERGFSDQVEPTWVEEDGRNERTWLHILRRE